MRWCWLQAALLLALAACSGGEGEGEETILCAVDEECPGVAFCIEGECVYPAEIGCDNDNTKCPAGFICLPSGGCTSAAQCECTGDDACPPGKICQDCACMGNVCSPEGLTNPCYNGCHEGTKTCQAGDWTQCNAPPVGEEILDGLDNDCDGETDEGFDKCSPTDVPLPCATPCGEGEQTCVDGDWSVCSATDDCLCSPAEAGTTTEAACGKCGKQTRTCGPMQWNGQQVYVWSDFAECMGEGVCAAQEEETEECGKKCGTTARTCTTECNWGEWSECIDGGACEAGATEDISCGNCGLQTKVCSDDCNWMPFGDCIPGAGCKTGEEDAQSCGDKCGVQYRYCEQSCDWGDWGSCEDEGVCVPGTKKTEACGFCGEQEVTCTQECAWGAPGACEGSGVCDPGDVENTPCGPESNKGICEQGTKPKTCNGNCQWNPYGTCDAVWPQVEVCGDGIDQDCDGQDLKQPDQYENNNDCTSCYWISGDDPQVTLYPTFDSAGVSEGGHDHDDYFCFYSVDNWNIPFTNEYIKLELKNQPAGGDGDLFLYRGQSDCESDSYVALSVTFGGANESIEWKESDADDTAVYYVRIQNWSSQPNCGKS